MAELCNPAAMSASQRAAPRFAARRLQDTPGLSNAERSPALCRAALKEGQERIRRLLF